MEKGGELKLISAREFTVGAIRPNLPEEITTDNFSELACMAQCCCLISRERESERELRLREGVKSRVKRGENRQNCWCYRPIGWRYTGS